MPARIGRIGDWNNPQSSSSRPQSRGSGPRVATLRDIGSGGGPTPMGMGGFGAGAGAGHGHEGDEDEEDRDEGESWYTGGERSGLSVEAPDRNRSLPGGDIVRDLLRRAAEAGPPPGAFPPTSASSATSGPLFTGGGHVLGGDEVETRYVPDPNAEQAPEVSEDEPPAIRHITFWRDGFSVEDGELMRYDDPANEQVLAEINSGRAPPQILAVQPGQPVELRVAKRLSEEYRPPPKRPAAPFSGSGNRLGSPVPGVAPTPAASSSSSSGTTPAASAGASAAGGSGTRFEVDQSAPTTSVQIRLADGTRMVCRMNLTHTVKDIRNFINASRPENGSRVYTIGTTFPNRTLDDDSLTIEQAGLVNSVIVQRWA